MTHLNRACEGKSCDGGAASAAESGGNIPVSFIDEAAAKGLTEDVTASFDQEGGDLSFGQFFQDISELHIRENEGAIFELIGENDGILRQVAAAGEDDAPGLRFIGLRQAAPQSESRIVAADGFGSDQNGVNALAESATVGSGGFTGDPLGFAGGASDASIEALPSFGDRVGEAAGDPFVKGADQLAAFFEHDAPGDLNALAG